MSRFAAAVKGIFFIWTDQQPIFQHKEVVLMSPKYCVAAVEKAIHILNFLAAHPDSTFTDIFTALGLSKSTTYQTLFTLESYQYVVRTKEKKYRLDVGILPLIYGVAQQNNLVETAREPLTELANETGLTVHLCALADSFRAICLYKIDGTNFTIRNTAVGRDLTLHTSACAKVLLAWMPPEQLPHYLANVTYTKFTDTTITAPEAFQQELIRSKERGYAIDNCEGAQGAMGIGVPILDDKGNAAAAISIGAIITEIPLDQYEQTAKKLQHIAKTISLRLFPGI